MSRALLIYALCLPLAVLIGFMLATPTDVNSFALILSALGAMTIPILLRQHHLFLAMTWNAAMIVFFLPGQPPLGLLVAVTSLTIAIIDRTMSKSKRFLGLPSVTWPLLVLGTVIVVTAELTGGIGGRVLGSETWGAKRYLGVFGGILGYFALTTQQIPKEKANLYTSLYFLGGMTSLISDLAYMGGSQFYFLFLLFPSDHAALQATTADTLMRLSGLAFACAAGYYFLLARHGIEGLFNPRKPWLLIMLGLFLVGSLLGGYRGLVILLGLVFVTQFFVEGVFRSKLGPVLVVSVLMTIGFTAAYIDRMPLSVQRAFSFLPLQNIDGAARMDAMSTLDWRLSMWKILIPEIPKYLLVGKGYSFSGTDYYLTQEAVHRGVYSAYEDILVSGNYHNGILTLLIPFGALGFAAFLWFCWAGFRVLHANLRYGDPALKKVNTFLLAYFVARLLFYFIFYGQFDLDFLHFTGLVGLSVALNGGMRRATSAEPVLEPVPELQPVRRAVAF